MKRALALGAAMTVAAGMLSLANSAAAATTVSRTGAWHTVSSKPGVYKLAVACPPGSMPRAGSVEFRERGAAVNSLEEAVPARHKGGSIGASGTSVWAKLRLSEGAKLQVRVTAFCR